MEYIKFKLNKIFRPIKFVLDPVFLMITSYVLLMWFILEISGQIDLIN